ncbi:MAG: 30S ribosomal protein S20, partial [Clostridia bacterium]|nr:30S ribosomal protein S20 [Clostridia bacterium]
MPNIKSAKKRVKVISAKTLQNKMFKNSLRTIVKKFNLAVESGDKAAAEVAYKDAVKKIDQAAARGLLHK